MRMPVLDRFMSHVEKHESGCWLWTGFKSKRGYGQFTTCFNGIEKIWLAHRFSLFVHGTELNKNLQVDHLCKKTSCVNPDHLEQVTSQENIKRSNGLQAINARKTHCIRGHEFNKENTYIYPRGKTKSRDCKTCWFLRQNHCKHGHLLKEERKIGKRRRCDVCNP